MGPGARATHLMRKSYYQAGVAEGTAQMLWILQVQNQVLLESNALEEYHLIVRQQQIENDLRDYKKTMEIESQDQMYVADVYHECDKLFKLMGKGEFQKSLGNTTLADTLLTGFQIAWGFNQIAWLRTAKSSYGGEQSILVRKFQLKVAKLCEEQVKKMIDVLREKTKQHLNKKNEEKTPDKQISQEMIGIVMRDKYWQRGPSMTDGDGDEVCAAVKDYIQNVCTFCLCVLLVCIFVPLKH